MHESANTSRERRVRQLARSASVYCKDFAPWLPRWTDRTMDDGVAAGDSPCHAGRILEIAEHHLDGKPGKASCTRGTADKSPNLATFPQLQKLRDAASNETAGPRDKNLARARRSFWPSNAARERYTDRIGLKGLRHPRLVQRARIRITLLNQLDHGNGSTCVEHRWTAGLYGG